MEAVRVTHLASFLILLGVDVQFREYVDCFLVSVRRIQAVGTHQCLCGLVRLFGVMVQLMQGGGGMELYTGLREELTPYLPLPSVWNIPRSHALVCLEGSANVASCGHDSFKQCKNVYNTLLKEQVLNICSMFSCKHRCIKLQLFVCYTTIFKIEQILFENCAVATEIVATTQNIASNDAMAEAYPPPSLTVRTCS